MTFDVKYFKTLKISSTWSSISSCNNDYQMVSGIINILKKVKDKENRMEIADSMVSQFKKEKIKFDYTKFIDELR